MQPVDGFMFRVELGIRWLPLAVLQLSEKWFWRIRSNELERRDPVAIPKSRDSVFVDLSNAVGDVALPN